MWEPHWVYLWATIQVEGIRIVAICGSLHGPFSSTSAVLYIILLLHPSPLHVVVCKRVQQYHSFGSPSLHIGILSIFPLKAQLHRSSFGPEVFEKCLLISIFKPDWSVKQHWNAVMSHARVHANILECALFGKLL